MKNNKIDCDNYNLIGGELKKSDNQFENLRNFINRWEDKIHEIKSICLNSEQARNLANDYIAEWDKFMYEDRLNNESDLLNQLSHDLYLAITIANVNYKKQFPTFWQNFHKLKLPDLHFHKND